MGGLQMLADTNRAMDALRSIPPDIPRDEWVRAGMAAQAAGLDFDDFNHWSAGAGNYDAAAARDTWHSFKPDKGVGAGTLFKLAAENGWRMGADKPQQKTAQASRNAAAPPRKTSPGMSPSDIWSRCEAATNAHPYITQKQAAGVPLGRLRVVPNDDGLTVQGELMAGALVVPVIRADGTFSSLQFIAPPDVAARLKTKGKPGKLNLPDCRLQGFFTVGETLPGGLTYIVEGIGAAWSCWQATGFAAVVCFGSGRMRTVANELRALDASARLVLVPDVGKESDAADIAREVLATVVTMPDGWPKNSDVNDLMQRDGGDALAALLESGTAPTPPPLPLSVVFADELTDTFVPPDELVEGVLTAGDGSVLYGDSNSGKTFLLIDMAAAVARGAPWMGRRTEQGLVVYLAAESPASVRSRLQAYQKHYGVKVPNFAIVQSPIDLFNGDADTDKVIQVVRQLEQQRGQKARLIIGDTLARLSAGANENAGQDMGLVVRRFDRIRTECKAHFCLIHHSGKSAAAGARGWSGVRAAVDTEIEISNAPTGRCCEITKQRDLNTKGERIGFRLDPVALGFTKWGAVASSCVVVAVDAPAKQTGKRMSECDGAVLEFLVGHKVGIKKRDVVTHFEGRYEKGPIYRAMKSLVTSAAIHEAAGMVCAAVVAK
jgi:putative DNA primase/helicase